MYSRIIWFPQFIFPNFRLKINLGRKLQLRKKDNKVTNHFASFLKFKVTDIIGEGGNLWLSICQMLVLHLISRQPHKMKPGSIPQMRKPTISEAK